MRKLFILFSLPFVVNAQNTFTTVAVGGNNLCAEFISTPDSSPPPEWDDQRVFTKLGREEIVREATERAFKKLGKVGFESWLNAFIFSIPMSRPMQYAWVDRANGTNEITYSKNPNNWIDYDKRVKFNIKYTPIKRKANTGGSSTPKLHRIHAKYKTITTTDGATGRVKEQVRKCDDWTEVIYPRNGGNFGASPFDRFWDNIGKNTAARLNIENEVQCKECLLCYREELEVNIEINPEIFDRMSLWIPNEGPNGKGRWAREPMEAIIYVILHEIGHIEAFLSNESKLTKYSKPSLQKQYNDEESAWEFASSVMNYTP